MEPPSIDPLLDVFVVEEEWEFSAPQYYDFNSPIEDNDGADRWFDEKLYDDVSPEFDEEEFDTEYDYGDSCPGTPASAHYAPSIMATPMTPSWRDRVEERSPQREDEAMGRIVSQVLQTQLSSVSSVGPSVTLPSTPQTPMSAKARFNTHSLQPVPMEHLYADVTQLSIPNAVILNRSPRDSSTTHKSNSIATKSHHAEPPSSSLPSATAEPAPNKPKVFTVTTISKTAITSTSNPISRIPVVAPSKPQTTTLKMPLPPVSQIGLPSSRPLNTAENLATSKVSIKSKVGSNISKPAPLQPASANRLNQLQGRSNASVHTTTTTTKSAKPVIPDGKSQIHANKSGMKRHVSTVPVTKQPFASQRSVVAPIRTIPQAPLLHTAMRTNRINSATDKQQQQLLGKENAQQQTALRSTAPQPKSAPSAVSKRIESVKRPLTVAVTPELMKRRRAKLKEEPRLTTEELRAMEAERIRREFFQDLHKKNLNRGLAPRPNFSHVNKPVKVAAKPGHWR